MPIPYHRKRPPLPTVPTEEEVAEQLGEPDVIKEPVAPSEFEPGIDEEKEDAA